MAKSTKVFILTPIGSLTGYNYIATPDYGTEEFPKPRGQYRINLSLPVNAASTALIERLEKQQAALYQRYVDTIYPAEVQKAKDERKRPPKQLDECQMPFYLDEETNSYIVTFKMHASFTDQKTKETRELTLKVFDSRGRRIDKVPRCGTGSEGRVNFSVTEFVSAVAGVGLSLQLSQFQLLKLVEFGGNDTFAGGAVDGYEPIQEGFGDAAQGETPPFSYGDGGDSGDQTDYSNVDF